MLESLKRPLRGLLTLKRPKSGELSLTDERRGADPPLKREMGKESHHTNYPESVLHCKPSPHFREDWKAAD